MELPERVTGIELTSDHRAAILLVTHPRAFHVEPLNSSSPPTATRTLPAKSGLRADVEASAPTTRYWRSTIPRKRSRPISAGQQPSSEQQLDSDGEAVPAQRRVTQQLELRPKSIRDDSS